MAGITGLGVSKKIEPQGTAEKTYELMAEDVQGDGFTLREDLFGYTIIAKTSITNYYLAVFLPSTIGNEGDFVRFRNLDDVDDTNEPYVEFYGEDWDSNLDTRYIDSGYVDSEDGWYYIQKNHQEVHFVKKEGKWRAYRDQPILDLAEFKDPTFYKLNIGNSIMSNSYMYIKINDYPTANFNEQVVTFQAALRIQQELRSLTHSTQEGHPSIGTVDYPFGDLNLKGIVNALSAVFSGTVKAADPVEATDLVNKQYFEANLPAGIDLSAIEQNILPDADYTRNIGEANKRFLDVYAKYMKGDSGGELRLNGSYPTFYGTSGAILNGGGIVLQVSSNGVQVTGKIYPNQDQTHDIGSSTARFNKLYIKQIKGSYNLAELWLTGNYAQLLGEAGVSLQQGYNTRFRVEEFNNVTYVHLIPFENELQNLGDPTHKFNTIHAKNANFTDGATGFFTSQDGKAITVTNGIITDIA